MGLRQVRQPRCQWEAVLELWRLEVSVADEAGGVVSAVYWTNKAGVAVVKGTHRKAKVIGMHVQNWRHRGAGKTDSAALAATVAEAPGKKGSAKNWTTDEETFKNTTTSHTTYTRKRTR